MLKKIIFILILYNCGTFCNCFEEITEKAFQGENNGILAAFGDFNSDKTIDIFQIVNDGKGVEVLEANIEEPYFRNSTIHCLTDEKIINVVPGDFDGDARMDILVVTQNSTKNPSKLVDILVFWGNIDSIECNKDIIATLTDQPLILDYNGDMIIDFLGQSVEGNVSIWLGSSSKTFKQIDLTHDGIKPQKLRIGHSSAFIDLNDDLVSDIFLTGQDSNEIWVNDNGIYKFVHNISNPTTDKDKFDLFGQISFLDFNADGKIDVIYPVCKKRNDHCELSHIFGLNFSNMTWEVIASNISNGNVSWEFRAPINNFPEMTQISLRAADFNMDGYPDFVTILQHPITRKTQVVLLKNEPCESCFFKRTLVPKFDMPLLDKLKDVVLVALYDIQDDGKIDLIVVTNEKNKWKTSVLKNNDKYDACFVKVLVISGRCLSTTDCPNKSVPYGTNQPGPYIKYEMTKPDGSLKTSSAGLLSQASYFSLQLPYCLFGLGQTPNFIETLKVSLPKNSSRIRSRTWEQIIPNSQIVIIPYPLDNSQKWVNKLFVTPSHLVIVSGIALLGTCGLITIIIGLLHLKEKREDRREKQQEANRFHFDAM